MPPPPIPQRNATGSMMPVIDRRGDSRFSDVSMHVGCINYPLCLSEDADGHVVHHPAPAIRSRKEGSTSSPIKRKFCDTDLSTDEPDADGDAERRVRSPRLSFHGAGQLISSSSDGIVAASDGRGFGEEADEERAADFDAERGQSGKAGEAGEEGQQDFDGLG
jgi:hypothetical protein